MKAIMKSGESKDIPVNGNYVHVDAGALLEITIDGQRNTVKRGEGLMVDKFAMVTVSNRGPDNDLVELRIGYGRIVSANDGQVVSITSMPAVSVNNFPALQPVSVSELPAVSVDNFPALQPVSVDNFPAFPVLQPVSVAKLPAESNQISTVPDVSSGVATAAQVISANAVRKSVKIKNLAANVEPVRVGGASIAADRGHELSPGESITLKTSAAVYVFCSVDQKVSVIECEGV